MHGDSVHIHTVISGTSLASRNRAKSHYVLAEYADVGTKMDKNTQQAIESGKTVLGIEFGSTRIKAVLIGADHAPIASGSHA